MTKLKLRKSNRAPALLAHDLFTGRRRIRVAITGTAGSGKTVLSTALPWHLKCQRPREFDLGDGVTVSGVVNRVPLPGGTSRLPIEGFIDQVAVDGNWPCKTKSTTYAGMTLKFGTRNGRRLYARQIEIELLDFPGERMADSLMYKLEYAKWSEIALGHLRDDGQARYATDYLALLSKGSSLDETELLSAYKRFLGRAYTEGCCRLLAPSTFFVDEDGNGIRTEVAEDSGWEQERTTGRPGNEFCPLDEASRLANPKLAKRFSRRYRRYVRHTVKPLFDWLITADRMVVVLDIPQLLMDGPVAYNDEHRLLERIIDVVNPDRSRWRKLLGVAQAANPFYWPGRLRRLAFVAGKSDMVAEQDRGRLDELLREMVEVKARHLDGLVDYRRFTCSAVCSTTSKGGRILEMALKLAGKSELRAASVSPLPPSWPDIWDGEDYSFWAPQPRCSPRRDKPPQHVGLDDLARFLLCRRKEDA